MVDHKEARCVMESNDMAIFGQLYMQHCCSSSLLWQLYWDGLGHMPIELSLLIGWSRMLRVEVRNWHVQGSTLARASGRPGQTLTTGAIAKSLGPHTGAVRARQWGQLPPKQAT